MDRNPTIQDEDVSQFCAMTGVRPEQVSLSTLPRMHLCPANIIVPKAQEYLAANGGDLEAAVTEFFAEQDEALQEGNTGPGQTLGESESAPSAGRSLAGSSSQSPSFPPQQSSTSRKSAPKKKFATLDDFSSGGGDDSEEEDDAVNRDLFAGGEKSGLAVQNPDDIKRKIIEKAKRLVRALP